MTRDVVELPNPDGALLLRESNHRIVNDFTCVMCPASTEVGENVRAGQPILMVEAAGKQWLLFNVREDYLDGLTVGKTVDVMRSGTGGAIKSVVTGLRPLGSFATWQAERVIGDHDRNTLRMRLDPATQPADSPA
jgi:HlyD family secretion protein